MDLFEKAIKNEKQSDNIMTALTCSSYKNVWQKEHKKDASGINDNSRLATLGDALISFIYAEHFYENGTEQISSKKQHYESDEFFVTCVAKKYQLLNYMRFDKDDDKIIKNYEYEINANKSKNHQDSKHKYIATTVEAVIGALYLDIKASKITNTVEELKDLILSWENLLDKDEDSELTNESK